MRGIATFIKLQVTHAYGLAKKGEVLDVSPIQVDFSRAISSSDPKVRGKALVNQAIMSVQLGQFKTAKMLFDQAKKIKVLKAEVLGMRRLVQALNDQKPLPLADVELMI
jgi:hypothetical protein